MKIRGANDRRDWMNPDAKPNRLPSPPRFNLKRMTGKQLVDWAEWAGISFHLRDDVLHITWKGETKPHRITDVLRPHRDKIERHVRRYQATP